MLNHQTQSLLLWIAMHNQLPGDIHLMQRPVQTLRVILLAAMLAEH